MKRYIRLIAGVLLTVMLCLSFCSCAYIDEERLYHAKWTDDAKNVISFRGNDYIKLPYCEDLNFIDSGEEEMSFVTENDVPLLLSSLYGDCVTVSKDGEFLSVETWSFLADEYTFGIYCRADLYNELLTAIETYKLDRYCVHEPKEYYDEDGYYHYESSYRLLSEKTTECIKTAISNGGVVTDSIRWDYGADIFLCDQSLRFISSDELDWMYLSVENDGSVSVATYDKDSYFSDDIKYKVYNIVGEEAEMIRQELFFAN